MKLRKRFAAMCAAAVMALGTLGIEANAAGYVYICSTSGGKVVYQFSNIDSTGYTSKDRFKVNYSGAHTVSYTPTAGSSTTITFIRGASTPDFSIIIPAQAPGMPSTLSNPYTFNTSYVYKIFAISGGSTTGNVTINNATEY